MSTADRVALLAVDTPEAIAYIDDTRAITFAQFARDIGKFAAALRGLGLRFGSTVVVGCEDVYIEWLLLLAFERLNVATASLGSSEVPEAYKELLAGVDLLLSDANVDFPDGMRLFRLRLPGYGRPWQAPRPRVTFGCRDRPAISCASSAAPVRPDGQSASPSTGACTICAPRGMASDTASAGTRATC